MNIKYLSGLLELICGIIVFYVASQTILTNFGQSLIEGTDSLTNIYRLQNAVGLHTLAFFSIGLLFIFKGVISLKQTK